MRYVVEKNFVRVIGKGWYGQKMCYEYPLSKSDAENIGEFIRENIEDWLSTHSGDFQSIDDFYATVGEDEIQFKDEEKEMEYWDIVNPQ